MRIITSPNSPFGARIEIAARVKNIDGLIRERPPASGIKSPEYLAINPVGRIPVLITETGTTIAESEAILDYLEDRFPSLSLRPRDADERARVNVPIRMMDAYVMAPVIRLFPHLNPATRDADVVANEVARWSDGLAAVAHFLPLAFPQAEAGITLADCVLMPSLHLSTRIAAMLELPADPIHAQPALVDYYLRTKRHPVIGAVLEELTAAQEASDLKYGRASVAAKHL